MIDFTYDPLIALLISEQAAGKRMYSKIVVTKELFEECKEFLFNKNYTLDYLFPSEIQYQIGSIQQVFDIVTKQGNSGKVNFA